MSSVIDIQVSAVIRVREVGPEINQQPGKILADRGMAYSIEVDKANLQQVLEAMQFNLDTVGTVCSTFATTVWHVAADAIKDGAMEEPELDDGDEAETVGLAVVVPADTTGGGGGVDETPMAAN